MPRIKDVKPLDDLMIMVTFANNVVKSYDVNKLINQYPVFEQLKNRAVFNLVHVDCGGFGIAWTDDIDLSE
ncbi:MAG: DUF2442 domain-containing protein, partial [Hyphomonadaceae bacterium]|nr:DUF2442 domain-containing protein [Clostridia bacterium]